MLLFQFAISESNIIKNGQNLVKFSHGKAKESTLELFILFYT